MKVTAYLTTTTDRISSGNGAGGQGTLTRSLPSGRQHLLSTR